MKKTVLLTLFCLAALLGYSQNSEIPEPEFADQPYIWLKDSNELVKLSKEKADFKTTMTMKMSYKYPGNSSKTKVPNSDNITFLVNTSMPAALSSINLYKLEVKKKKKKPYRFVEVMSAGFGGANMRDENIIAMDYKKVADDIYELVLSSSLTKGEYTITNGMNSFTFSIE